MNDNGYYHHPAISGDTVYFVSEDDAPARNATSLLTTSARTPRPVDSRVRLGAAVSIS